MLAKRKTSISLSWLQLWELARLTSAGKPVEQVYERYKKVIAELIATRSQWTKDLPNVATKANEKCTESMRR